MSGLIGFKGELGAGGDMWSRGSGSGGKREISLK